MRNEINVTDEQIEALFDKAFGAAPCFYEGTFDGAFTRDTLEQFAHASKGYVECRPAVFSEIGGCKTLFLGGAQPRKGDQRRDVHVIDFGSVRVVFQ